MLKHLYSLDNYYCDAMKKCFFLYLIMSVTFSFAQVGIGTTTPSPAAMLEISSGSSGNYVGFLPPRIPTSADQAAMTPAASDVGLMVFVEETGCLDFWNGTVWENIYCTGGFGEVWINEFHYTNSGADINQFLEIAGPVGIDLSGYYFVRYRGDTGQPYGPILTLTGTFDDEQNGFGAVSVDATNLRNDNSGFALVGPDGRVIQFFSYEGTFTATGGPAAGLTSIDVGLIEDNGTTGTQSIHLVGTGNTFTDFTWATSIMSTDGAQNIGQTFN